MKSTAEIKLDKEEITSMQQEDLLKAACNKEDLLKANSEEVAEIDIYANEVYQPKQSYIQIVSNKVQQCYEFSNYLLDPNKCRFNSGSLRLS